MIHVFRIAFSVHVVIVCDTADTTLNDTSNSAMSLNVSRLN